MTLTLYSVPLSRLTISMVFTSSPTNVSRAGPGAATVRAWGLMRFNLYFLRKYIHKHMFFLLSFIYERQTKHWQFLEVMHFFVRSDERSPKRLSCGQTCLRPVASGYSSLLPPFTLSEGKLQLKWGIHLKWSVACHLVFEDWGKLPERGWYTTLYPMVGEGGTSQLILKRLYHSSETRRFLGAVRGTGGEEI